MTTVLAAALFALVWGFATQTFTLPNVLASFAAAAALLDIARAPRPLRRVLRHARVVALALVFVWELVVSSIGVALIVVSPRRTPRPAILAYPLRVTSDAQITLLANLVTLTPGTLSMDVSRDRSTLFVHAIDGADADPVIQRIRNRFESRIMKVFAP